MSIVEQVASPGDAEQQAILAVLVAHNEAAVGPTKREPLAIVVRGEAGTIIGGLWGITAYRWLFVQYLALPPEARGRGTGRMLMKMAESEARTRDCVGVWLDTFSFQVRGFYERLGYAVCGRIGDFPPGEERLFLFKRIDGC